MESKHRLLDVLGKFIGAAVPAAHQNTEFKLSKIVPSVGQLRIGGGRWSPFEDRWPDKNVYNDRGTGSVIHEDWNLSLRIRYINLNRSANTTLEDRVIGIGSPPIGFHVFGFNHNIFPDDITTRLYSIFTNGTIPRDHGSNIIFYKSDDRQHLLTFEQSFDMLRNIDTVLAEMVLKYGKAVQHILSASDDDLNSSSMSMVHYAVGRGIRQHIDNITDAGGTVGPLVSIALGNEPKFLDLMPTITDTKRLRPVRVTVEPGQVIVMDGDCRLEYAHSVPTGHSSEMFSLLFKFRRIRDTLPGRINSQLREQIYYSIDPSTGELPSEDV